MTHIQGPAYTGQLACDLTNVKNELVDLAPGALIGAQVEQDGIAGVLAELARVMPAHGEEAEVRLAVYDRVVDATGTLDKLNAHEIILEKMLEVVRETRGLVMNNREHDLRVIAARVLDTATRQDKPDLLAMFEKTLKYRSQMAQKAVATRKKKNQAKNDTNAPESSPG